MKEPIDDRLRNLLREAAPPLEHDSLERDLWSAMTVRLDARRAPVSPLDWALAAALICLLLLFPQMIPGLLYHL